MQIITVRYIGPHDRVYVPAQHGGAEHLVERGESIEVGDGLAARMLEQPTNWELVADEPSQDAPDPPAEDAGETSIDAAGDAPAEDAAEGATKPSKKRGG